MTDRWERLTDLYHVAVALPEDERASLLTEACADDPALQAEVERLVAAHDRVSPPVATQPPPEPDKAPDVDPPPSAEPRAAHPRPDAATEPADGEAIDAFADARQLSIGERLELFVETCNAVSNLHRRAVTHGALHTANIRVSKSGVPKLVGLGTAEYAATAADDIQSLGSVLDALLGSDRSAAARRGLRADLDAIVRTALREDPRRRYGSVDELAGDVGQALENIATRARPSKQRPLAASDATRQRRAILAWALAAVALVALGVKAAPFLMQRTAATPVEPPVALVEPTSRARILVPDLANHTGDPRLVAALSEAFRTGLGESPGVLVVGTPGRRVDAEVRGSVDTVAAGYSIMVQVTRPARGDSSPALLETATDSADVMRALGTLAERVREQLGESAASIAASPRLDEVTTASLPALRAYANGARAINAGDRAAGLRSLNAAVALDTGFAAAHRLMAITYSATGDVERSSDALDHAIANYTRLPFYTRYHTVGSHAMTVLGHHAAAIDAYNRILDRYPDDVRALEGLGRAHAARREYAVQESLMVRAMAADSSGPSFFNQLTLAQLNQGKYGAARRTLERAERRFPGTRMNDLAAVSLALARRDWEAAEREAGTRLRGASGDSAQALDGLETLASIRLAQGRLAEAERDLRRVAASATRRDGARKALRAAVRLAYIELRYRRAPAAALGTMTIALRRYPLARIPESERPYDEMARFFADAGQPARALELVAEAGRTRLGRRRPADADRRWTMGTIATAEGRAWEGEIEIYGASETHPCPICVLPDLARAYEVAGKPDSAIATYQRYLSTPWQSRFDTDAIELGSAMERLGALYQQQRDGAKAAALYTELLQLWRGADAELQPLVADVRRRLEQTAAVAAAR
ncbi:MAG TPA: hypothetical protein VFZ21_02050 [Gemmatimonadaceae bacterium]|nr:hypothetical protein [Gemmatimonadaceae bacterium]